MPASTGDGGGEVAELPLRERLRLLQHSSPATEANELSGAGDTETDADTDAGTDEDERNEEMLRLALQSSLATVGAEEGPQLPSPAVAGTAPSEVIDLLTPSPMPPPAAGVGPPSGEPRQWDSDAIDSAAGELRAARRLGILPAR
jgi:hypothetical protein